MRLLTARRDSPCAPARVLATALAMVLVPVGLLSGCGSTRPMKAPVEDRTPPAARSQPAAPAGASSSSPAPARAASPSASSSPSSATAADAKPLPPGAENAGKPGYYTVKAGDTLIRIGLETGQNWRDIQVWNGIANPNLIEVGQVLRVVPPNAPVPPVAAATANPVAGVTTQGVPDASARARPLAGSSAGSSGTAPAPAPTSPSAAPKPAPLPDLQLIWPSNGRVIETFDEARNKGVDIAGAPGDPVLAAADGRVIYAGAELRGYGNLIIIKHNDNLLTAYAHNQSLLVKEDQAVRQGQKIAEMGSSDADRVKLHFEVRRQGKPVDPLTQLPPR